MLFFELSMFQKSVGNVSDGSQKVDDIWNRPIEWSSKSAKILKVIAERGLKIYVKIYVQSRHLSAYFGRRLYHLTGSDVSIGNSKDLKTAL